jgi:hypothetical protein
MDMLGGDSIMNVDPKGLVYSPWGEHGLPLCPCGIELVPNWDCVNETWATLNGGVTVEAGVGLGATFWLVASSSSASVKAGSVGSVVGVWVGLIWMGAALSCKRCQ